MSKDQDDGVLHSSMLYMIGTLISGSVKASDHYDVTYALGCLDVIEKTYKEFEPVVEQNCDHIMPELQEYFFAITKIRSLLKDPVSSDRSYQIGIYQLYLREKHKNSFVDLAIELKKDGKYLN